MKIVDVGKLSDFGWEILVDTNTHLWMIGFDLEFGWFGWCFHGKIHHDLPVQFQKWFHLRKCSETSMKLEIFLQNSLRYTDVYYIYIHACMHAYMHPCIHASIYIHTYIPTYIHTYIHTYIPTYLHTYIPTYIHTYLHTYIHLQIYIYIILIYFTQ